MAAELKICPDPVFVIGVPRSGTTIVAWALAQHTRFWTSEESQFMWDLFGDAHLKRIIVEVRTAGSGNRALRKLNFASTLVSA